jgi:hypothetical protein
MGDTISGVGFIYHETTAIKNAETIRQRGKESREQEAKRLEEVRVEESK